MKRIDKLDKIILSDDDLNMLFEWRDNHVEYVRAFKPVMQEGLIKVGEGHTQAFHTEGNMLYFEIYVMEKIIYSFVINLETMIGKEIVNALDENFNTEAYNQSIVSLYASIMAYMEYYSDKKEYVDVETIKSTQRKQKKSKTSKVKKKSAIKIRKKVYRLNVNAESVKMDKRRYERQMSKWTVRGHWRTYKNGNKVWVKPYEKGQGEDIQGKEYKL